jgi:hypothetical protein
VRHYTEEDLILHYYNEGSRRADIEVHLDQCERCAAAYRALAGTLRLIATPEAPERGDQYGLEVWQRIRHRLPGQDVPWWSVWFRVERLAAVGAFAVLLLAAFVTGRWWSSSDSTPAPTLTSARQSAEKVPGPVSEDSRQRVLLTSVADHFDRSERVLTDIMNAPDGQDISAEQRWAEDLVVTSRLYRQDAADAGEHSVAAVLDELERSLLEIVHSPSRATAANLEEIRRRIDAASLLFKVRVLGDELRQREHLETPHRRALGSQTS